VQVDTTLGPDYSWAGGHPGIDGGTLRFKESTLVPLSRSESTFEKPGYWSR
jgi:hypothetical protein